MKILALLGLPALVVGLLLDASPALAQTKDFHVLDTSGDGFLDEGELLAALGSTSLLSHDQNSDSRLSRDEVRPGPQDEGDKGGQDDSGGASLDGSERGNQNDNDSRGQDGSDDDG